MPESLFYRSYYDNHASRFDATRLWGSNEIKQTVQAVIGHLPVGENVLEMGCGSFKHGTLLASAGFNVIGLDFSIEQLRNVQHGATVLCANVRSLPFACSTLGGVLGVMILHQVAACERQLVLTEIRRTLRPAGNLILKTCTHEDLRRRPLTKWFPSSLKINLERFPSDQDIKWILTESGFGLIKTWSTESVSIFPTDVLISMLETRPSSSLRLVPEAEYADGLKRFDKAHEHEVYISLAHYHTFYVARRS
jgi:SAM-dependent methyltransferase